MGLALGVRWVGQTFASRHNVIGAMSWELAACSIAGVSLDHLRFGLALLAAVILGFGMPFIRSSTCRHLYALGSGILLVYYPFGAVSLTSTLAPAAALWLLMAAAPRHCGYASWVLCFAYLTYVHWAAQSTVNWRIGQMDFTGGVMVLMLKLVSLAVSYQDHGRRHDHKRPLRPYQSQHLVTALPSALEMLSFVFASGNLLAGPLIEFEDWKRFMERRGDWSNVRSSSSSGGQRITVAISATAGSTMPASPHPPHKRATSRQCTHGGCSSSSSNGGGSSSLCGSAGSGGLGRHRLLLVLQHVAAGLALMLVHLLLSPVVNMGVLSTAWYARQNLFVRLLSMQVSDMVYTTQHFFVWKMAEAANTASGLNLAGLDKDGEPVWGRCRNAQVMRYLLSSNGRAVPQAWNIKTGNFLRRYCYERLPRGSSERPAFFQLLGTQLVSGLWHGLYPGYHLFFASSALYLQAASVLARWERSPSAPRWLLRHWSWHVVKVYWANLGAHYLGVAFVLLDFNASMRAWRSVYFLPHVGMLLFCAAGIVWRHPCPQAQAQEADNAKQRRGKEVCAGKLD